jgi:uncharacterized protein YybS (DUF2232 family)
VPINKGLLCPELDSTISSLHAGLELGILSPQLFTMMVIMALATTLMTAPVLRRMKITTGQPVRPAAQAAH